MPRIDCKFAASRKMENPISLQFLLQIRNDSSDRVVSKSGLRSR
jgi:hypothetical protein